MFYSEENVVYKSSKKWLITFVKCKFTNIIFMPI